MRCITLRTYVIFLRLSFLVTMVAFCAGARGNVLQNSGFEEPGPPDAPPSWRSFTPRGSGLVATTQTQPLEGTRCLAVETTSNITAVLVSDPPVEVAPGEELTLTVGLRAEDVSSEVGGGLTLNAGYITGAGRYFRWDRKQLEPPPTSEWTEVSHKVKVPESAAYASFQMGLRSATGRCWWDKARMTSKTPLAVRFATEERLPVFGKTMVQAVLLNRGTRPAGSKLLIKTEPGGHDTELTVNGETTETISLPFTIDERGQVALSVEVSDAASGERLYQAKRAVIVPQAITVDPLMPTHWIAEDDAEPGFESRVYVNEDETLRPTLSLRCVVRGGNGKEVARDEKPAGAEGDVVFAIKVPREAASAPGDLMAEFELVRAGKAIASHKEPWQVVPRAKVEVSMNEAGFPVVDGKPFFPIVLYMVPKKYMEEVQQAGFNTTQSYPAFAGPGSSNRTAKKFLDDAHAAGLKTLTFVSHGADRLSDEDALRRIRTFKNHPATLVWYQEEVAARGYKSIDYIRNLYEMLKREASEHPILQGDQRDESSRMKGNPRFFPDEYMHAGTWWWYPVPLRSVQSLDNYEGDATGPEMEFKPPVFLTNPGTDKPIWVALQCYRKPGIADGRFPTPEEYRAMAYIVICHGSKGLIYYTGSGEHEHGILDRQEEGHWEELKKLVGELRDMSPVFMSPDAEEQVKMEPADALVSTLLKQTEEGRVLMAVNRSIVPAKMKFKVPGVSTAGEVTVRGEDRKVKLAADGILADEFKPYAVHIYELP